MCDPVTALGTAVGVGTKILGAGEQAGRAKRATRQLEAGRQAGIEELRGAGQAGAEELRGGLTGFEEAMAPFQPLTQQAITQAQDILGGADITTSPIFQAQQRLLSQQLAQTGQTQSPFATATLSTPLIAQEYQRQLARLEPFLGRGFQAGGAIGGARLGTGTRLAELGRGTAQDITNLLAQQGDIRAAGTLAQPTTSGLLSNIGGQLAPFQSSLSNLFGGGAVGGLA